jgi:hypothetical protein
MNEIKKAKGMWEGLQKANKKKWTTSISLAKF